MQFYSYSDEYSETVTYPDKALPIKTWLSHSRDFPTRSDVNHWHNDFELLYILEGNMKYNVNGEILPLDKGSMLFVNSGNMHFGFQEDNTDCSIRCIVFHPSLLVSATLGQSLDKLCGQNAPPYLLFHSSKLSDKAFTECVKNIERAFSSDSSSRSLELLAEIYLLCARLIERIENTEHSVAYDTKQVQAMHRMTGFIQRNYSEKISLNDIAEAGAICRSKCCKIFREFLGKTPVEYLTEYRISKSIELLNTTDMSITDIAVNCGFCGSSYYAETFMKLMKCTPSEYRKK